MNEQTALKIDQSIDAAFYCDVLCFFAGARSGHVDYYTYSSPAFAGDPVNGGQQWKDFIANHAAYYPFHDELKLLAAHTDELAARCQDAQNFVDLGPGSIEAFESKALPLLRAIQPCSYIAADINHDYAEDVVDLLHRKEPGIKAQFHICNFFERPPIQLDKSLLFLVGSTLGNIQADLRFTTPREALTKTLRWFGACLPDEGYFAFTYDANDDAESIRRAYDHPALAAMTTGFIDRVKRDLPTEGLDAGDFSYRIDWSEKDRLLTLGLETKRNIAFSIAGHRFDLAAGTRLHVTNSFRFTDDMIRAAAQEAGFSSTTVRTLDGSSMRLALLTRE